VHKLTGLTCGLGWDEESTGKEIKYETEWSDRRHPWPAAGLGFGGAARALSREEMRMMMSGGLPILVRTEHGCGGAEGR
jgi:hypothetical protein